MADQRAKGLGERLLALLVRSTGAALVLLLLGWLATGFYTVEEGQVGVVRIFGRISDAAVPPGLHWRPPYPISRLDLPRVDAIRSVPFGFREERGRSRDVPREGMMLTGDMNILQVNFVVQYRVTDAVAFLYRVAEVEDTIRDAAEAAMREVVGRLPMDTVLTTGREHVELAARDLLQRILDRYGAGVGILRIDLKDVHPPGPVADAFKDVASAKEDRERMINDAQGYANRILPEARGEAARIVRAAEAEKARMVARAQGEAERFLSMWRAYRRAPGITRDRLYLERMARTLRQSRVIVVGEGLDRVMPLLDAAGRRKGVGR